LISHNRLFEQIISLDNLFLAWEKFKIGKTNKLDVQEFNLKLEDNIFNLYSRLKNKTYSHSVYHNFYINDPKRRYISKAYVKDRIVHQAVYQKLYPIFDKSFIHDSYSSRLNKGTHKAINRLKNYCEKVSLKNTQNCFVLKCDIKKFFDSIDHNILLELIQKKITDENTLWLVKNILDSFEKEKSTGLPLGNVTSQLFCNIYLNELDQFIKHKLKIKYYLRYCDDFAIVNKDKKYLENLIPQIDNFLKQELKLNLHARKTIYRKYLQGVDFLGYVILPHHKVLRTKTKKRMIRKLETKKLELKQNIITQEKFNASLNSYLGMLGHCEGHKVEMEVKKTCQDLHFIL